MPSDKAMGESTGGAGGSEDGGRFRPRKNKACHKKCWRMACHWLCMDVDTCTSVC